MRIPGVVRARFAAGAGTAIGPLMLRWAMADFIIVIYIGSPMVASWELRTSLAILRTSGVVWGRQGDARVLAEMRRYLEQLPKTPHPLDG